MATSAHLLMTLLTEGQASGEVTANEMFKILEALCFHKALDKTNTVGTATEGNVYICGTSPTGAWTGHANHITIYIGGSWRFIPPEIGWVLFDDLNRRYNRWDGTAWVDHLLAIEPADSQRMFRSSLPDHATALLLISATAYFVYMGRTTKILTPQYVEFFVSTIGAGAQVAEVGLFSTPLGPNNAGQSLTKIVSTGTVDGLTGTGMKRNSAPFATQVPAGTHLWAGIRTAMATTQPTIESLCKDFSEGAVLTTAGAGVLTGAGPFTGAQIAAAVGPIAPDLRVRLD